MTRVFLGACTLIQGRYPRRSGRDGVFQGKVVGQYNSHSWMIVFSFRVEESGFHEDKIRLSWGLAGHDADGEMPIEKRPSLFGSGVAIVISVKIFFISMNRTGVAIVVAFAVIDAVAVAALIASCASITVKVAARIDSHWSIVVTSPLPTMATVARGLDQILPALRGIGDSCGVRGLVRFIGIIELDSGVK